MKKNNNMEGEKNQYGCNYERISHIPRLPEFKYSIFNKAITQDGINILRLLESGGGGG